MKLKTVTLQKRKFLRDLRNFWLASAIILSVLAVFIHIYVIFKYSSGMPYRDDFAAIFGFLNRLPDLTLNQKILHIFNQNNEHRIVLDNLISLTMVAVTGRFDFVWMIWIGNIGWLFIVIFFWNFSQKNKINFLEFSPILICLMCLSHWELMTMAMAGVQHYFQVFFVVLSVYFLTLSNITLALFFFTCALFSSGGGICVIPVIIFYYLFRKEWAKLLIASITVATILIIYFPLLNYTTPAGHATLKELILTLESPLYLIFYSFGFLGNLGNTYKFSIGLGILLMTYIYFKRKFLYENYPFLYWLTVYLAITALTNAITRGGTSIRTGQGSRYTIYSLILISIVYLTCILSASSNKLRYRVSIVGLSLSIIVFLYWLQHGQENISIRFRDLESGVLQYFYISQECAVNMLKRAKEIGYYLPTKDTIPDINTVNTNELICN